MCGISLTDNVSWDLVVLFSSKAIDTIATDELNEFEQCFVKSIKNITFTGKGIEISAKIPVMNNQSPTLSDYIQLFSKDNINGFSLECFNENTERIISLTGVVRCEEHDWALILDDNGYVTLKLTYNFDDYSFA